MSKSRQPRVKAASESRILQSSTPGPVKRGLNENEQDPTEPKPKRSRNENASKTKIPLTQAEEEARLKVEKKLLACLKEKLRTLHERREPIIPDEYGRDPERDRYAFELRAMLRGKFLYRWPCPAFDCNQSYTRKSHMKGHVMISTDSRHRIVKSVLSEIRCCYCGDDARDGLIMAQQLHHEENQDSPESHSSIALTSKNMSLASGPKHAAGRGTSSPGTPQEGSMPPAQKEQQEVEAPEAAADGPTARSPSIAETPCSESLTERSREEEEDTHPTSDATQKDNPALGLSHKSPTPDNGEGQSALGATTSELPISRDPHHDTATDDPEHAAGSQSATSAPPPAFQETEQQQSADSHYQMRPEHDLSSAKHILDKHQGVDLTNARESTPSFGLHGTFLPNDRVSHVMSHYGNIPEYFMGSQPDVIADDGYGRNSSLFSPLSTTGHWPSFPYFDYSHSGHYQMWPAAGLHPLASVSHSLEYGKPVVEDRKPTVEMLNYPVSSPQGNTDQASLYRFPQQTSYVSSHAARESLGSGHHAHGAFGEEASPRSQDSEARKYLYGFDPRTLRGDLKPSPSFTQHSFPIPDPKEPSTVGLAGALL